MKSDVLKFVRNSSNKRIREGRARAKAPREAGAKEKDWLASSGMMNPPATNQALEETVSREELNNLRKQLGKARQTIQMLRTALTAISTLSEIRHFEG